MTRRAEADITRMPRRQSAAQGASSEEMARPRQAPHPAQEIVRIAKLDTTLREFKAEEGPFAFAIEKRLGSAEHQRAHRTSDEQTALYQARCTSHGHRDLALCVIKVTNHLELARNEWDHLTNMRSSAFPAAFIMGRLSDVEDRFAIVMEFVHGETLSSLMARGFGEDAGPAPVEKALEIMSPLAGAFRDLALSLHPFVHRDVKPDNIIVGERDGKRRTRLIDLGVSSHVGDPRQHEHLGYSASFAAPELVRPQDYPAGEVFSIDDARIDTYGLAATLYALVAGRPPRCGAGASPSLSGSLRHDASTITAIKQLAQENIERKHGLSPADEELDHLAAIAVESHDQAFAHALACGLAPLQSQRPSPTEFFDMLPTNYRAAIANDIHLLFLERLANKEAPAARPLRTVHLGDGQSVDLQGTALDDSYRYPAFHEDFHLASKLYNSGSYHEAVPLLMKLDEAGDPTSSYNLGVCYKDGLGGLERDHQKKLACWMRAADGGHIVAIFNVGVCHEEGLGVPKSPEMRAAAKIWYERAAALGFPAAEARLANLGA